ncbi:UDP-glucose 4-epimerase [Micromonospora sediminicola]|uniref:UDP-glucose 4-epimerase n=1 Tax=Micromonospora sediminicola TaxID=946078 RepID=A0A1A9B8H8_9ACTN|nr:UDP-glucose 4-epimerase GalE [Micromonospora sediminicola]SBT65830.1 UDP-glucose 4-epimerase [Micromonospora sediminicola]
MAASPVVVAVTRGGLLVKVLIAGGAGFIGSTVASALTDAGHTPVVLDNLVTGRREFCRGRAFQLGDIGDADAVDRMLRRHPDIGVVVHCAALIAVPDSVARPVDYYRANVSATLEFVDRLLAHGVHRLIFSSSAAIYAPGAGLGVDETSPLEAGSPYAQTKLVVERMLADIAASSPLRVLSLRYFNPIGADPAMRTGLQTAVPSHALGRLMLAHRAGVPFAVNGLDWPTRDGSGLRDYVHVWDLAVAHLRALERFDDIFAVGAAPHVAVNLGSGTGTTVLELVAAFNAVVDRPVLVREAPRRPGDAAGAYARGRRARELLGWRARRDLATGIADSLAWHDRRERLLGDLAPRRRQLAG